MKAAIFEKPGLENLKVKDNVERPRISDHDILIKVKMAGVNKLITSTIQLKRVPEEASLNRSCYFCCQLMTMMTSRLYISNHGDTNECIPDIDLKFILFIL